MSALTTHTFGKYREKENRKETKRKTPTSDRKPRKAKNEIT
jgi:hypothetical protein